MVLFNLVVVIVHEDHHLLLLERDLLGLFELSYLSHAMDGKLRVELLLFSILQQLSLLVTDVT